MRLSLMPQTLSEAIRAGAKMRPQGRGVYLANNRTCALGAALDAMGYYAGGHSRWQDIFEIHWPGLHTRDAVCPIANGRCPEHYDPRVALSISVIVYYLNDYHQWTREQIADWIVSIGDIRTCHIPVAIESESESGASPVEVTAEKPAEIEEIEEIAEIEERELICV